MWYDIATGLWDCTLSLNTLLLPWAPWTTLLRKHFACSSGSTSDQVLPPSELVTNFEQMFSPSVHLGYWDFGKQHGISEHTDDNCKVMSTLDVKALHFLSEHWALHLILHAQVKRQKHEIKKFWQSAQALPWLQIPVMGLRQGKCHSGAWHHCLSQKKVGRLKTYWAWWLQLILLAKMPFIQDWVVTSKTCKPKYQERNVFPWRPRNQILLPLTMIALQVRVDHLNISAVMY